jgi:hypothetical protein
VKVASLSRQGTRVTWLQCCHHLECPNTEITRINSAFMQLDNSVNSSSIIIIIIIIIIISLSL